MKKIYLGFINYASDTESVLSESAFLTTEELQRLDTFGPELSRRAFLAGRTLARSLLATPNATRPEAIQFTLGKNGKPHCSSHTGYHFSLSHSHGLAAIAVCETNIGLDLEAVRPGRDFSAIARAVFSDAEQKILLAAEAHPEELFYHFWTRKEAWLKLKAKSVFDIGKCPDFDVNQSGCMTLGVGTAHRGESFFSTLAQVRDLSNYVLALALPLPDSNAKTETPGFEILNGFTGGVQLPEPVFGSECD